MSDAFRRRVPSGTVLIVTFLLRSVPSLAAMIREKTTCHRGRFSLSRFLLRSVPSLAAMIREKTTTGTLQTSCVPIVDKKPSSSAIVDSFVVTVFAFLNSIRRCRDQGINATTGAFQKRHASTIVDPWASSRPFHAGQLPEQVPEDRVSTAEIGLSDKVAGLVAGPSVIIRQQRTVRELCRHPSPASFVRVHFV